MFRCACNSRHRHFFFWPEYTIGGLAQSSPVFLVSVCVRDRRVLNSNNTVGKLTHINNDQDNDLAVKKKSDISRTFSENHRKCRKKQRISLESRANPF